MKDKYGDNIEMKLNNKEIDTLIKRKTIKGIIIGTVLGGIITGGIGVAAVTLQANQIKYTPSNEKFTVTNVEEAMNELYNLSNELENRSQVINLGTGTSFDVTSYEGYENFTVDNFIVCASEISTTNVGQDLAANSVGIGTGTFTITPVVNYNPSTGVLTISGLSSSVTREIIVSGNHWKNTVISSAISNPKVYLVLNGIS